MTQFNWICPYCNQHATITHENFSSDYHSFEKGNKDKALRLITNVIVCPNGACKEYSIDAYLFKEISIAGRSQKHGSPLLTWRLKPNSSAKPFPDYIPNVIISDYNEACLIRDLSPSVSNTFETVFTRNY